MKLSLIISKSNMYIDIDYHVMRHFIQEDKISISYIRAGTIRTRSAPMRSPHSPRASSGSMSSPERCPALIEGAEHCPHDQYPDQVAALTPAFRRLAARA